MWRDITERDIFHSPDILGLKSESLSEVEYQRKLHSIIKKDSPSYNKSGKIFNTIIIWHVHNARLTFKPEDGEDAEEY